MSRVDSLNHSSTSRFERGFGFTLVSIGAVIVFLGLLFLSTFPPSSTIVTDRSEAVGIVMLPTGLALVVSSSMYTFRMRTPSERVAEGMVLAGIAAGIVWLFWGSGYVLIVGYTSYCLAATIPWKLLASICSAYLILALAIYHRSW
jgi:hypothetical protein